MTTSLTWAIVGASDIAATRMIPAMRAVGDEIAVVISSDQERARAFAQTNAIRHGSTDIADALTDEIDIVYIANANARHHIDALTAIRGGKHVLCEKPLALTVDDARRLVEEADAAGVVFAVNHHLPGSPLHVAARRLVEEGAIGRVLSARVNHAVNLPDRLKGWRITDPEGGGVMLDITCHDASVLNPLLGRPTRIAALAVGQGTWADSGTADAAMTVIEYEGAAGERILAQTHDAFTVPFSPTSLEIQGTEGSIRVLDAMTQDTAGTVFVIDANGEREIPVDTSADLYSIVLNGVHAAIENTGRPTATGADGLLALAVALGAVESIRTATTVAIPAALTSERGTN